MHTEDQNDPQDTIFEAAAEATVELGNNMLEADEETDIWELASGIMAGAVQFWLYSRQPCGDPECDSCAEVATAAQRLQKLLDETRQLAEESEYFHTPHDSNAGSA